jgi:putative ABC transport system permease protein
MSIFRRVLATFRKRKLEDEIAEEMRYHVEARTELNMEKGQNADEAHASALRQFGNATQQREAALQADMAAWAESLGKDLRYAARTLRRNRLFTIFAVLTMAMGIGATTLMFSVVNSLLLEPLPYKDPARLYTVWQKLPQEERVSFSPREFLIYQETHGAFSEIAAFTGSAFVVSGLGEPRLALGQMVTPGFFQVMGVTPMLGRGFLEWEGEAGHDHEVILGEQLWREWFSGQKDVLGKTLMMNGEAYSIIGVLPASFEFPGPTYKLWVPAALRAPLFQQHLDGHLLKVVGRLNPGVTDASLQSELATVGKRLDQDQEGERHYYAIKLPDLVSGHLRRPLLVLLFAVGLLLVIACANVANMMLARATVRKREMAMRAALGASQRRLLRQLLTESILLSLIGGAVGLLLAYAALQFFAQAGVRTMPELAHVQMNVPVLLFVVVLSTATGILFGLAPALMGSRTNLQESLKQSTQSSGSKGSERVRSLLVFGEIGLSSLLLVCSGLMLRSFVRLSHQEPGFAPENLIAVETDLMQNRYPDAEALLRFYHNTLESVKNIPGVSAVAMTSYLPFGGNLWGNSFEIEGKLVPVGSSAQIRPVSHGYFHTMSVPVLQGHEFTEKDTAAAPGVALVNQTFVRQFWTNESPIGKRLRFDENWLTIVGVCADIKHNGLDQNSDPEIYVPYPQLSAGILRFLGRDQSYVLRVAGAEASVIASARNVIHAEDPEVVVKVDKMQSLIDETIAEPRFRTSLIEVFSVLALLLAAVGIYAVMAYSVTQRFKELGIRIALGAQQFHIRKLVLGQAFRLAALGIGSGLLAAFFLSRFLRSLLFGVTVHDLLTFAGVPLFMLAIVLLASYWPARRAARVNPTISLRQE